MRSQNTGSLPNSGREQPETEKEWPPILSMTPERRPNGPRAGELKTSSRSSAFVRLVGCLLSAAVLSGCELVPTKPDAVFVLYRDRMKVENLNQARELLSEESRNLVFELTSQFKLKQPPENLAVLNVLDPVATPTVVKVEDSSAILQIRTLKGGLRIVRLVRKDPNSPWRIDIFDELKSLKTFLEASTALDLMREQAGEYAAAWKAFSDQIGRIPLVEPPLREGSPPEPPRVKPLPKKRTKPGSKKKRQQP